MTGQVYFKVSKTGSDVKLRPGSWRPRDLLVVPQELV